MPIGTRRGPEERRRVGATPRRPLPAECVVAQIGIDECIPEPAGALQPMHKEILDEKRRHDEPHAVVDPTRILELAHSRVDNRVTRLSMPPRLEPVEPAA